MSARSAREILGPRGPFAARLRGYEPRPGQLDVADAVEALLDNEGTLLCEAGTGIGKTFAYLVPALLSGRTTIISTATKNLQDQIAERDLPLVQEALGTDVPVAVMKGLGNYLCRRRYREFTQSAEAGRPIYARDLDNIRAWLKRTETGDLTELPFVSEQSRVLAEISSSSDTRIGPRCAHYNECFVTQMRAEAEPARIIVVNHHLFFADLALRGPHPGRVLPDYDSVIFDEAHQIEDIAALFFGARLSLSMILRLLAELRRALGRVPTLGAEKGIIGTMGFVETCEETAQKFFASLEEPGARVPAPRTFGPGDLEGLMKSADPLRRVLRDLRDSLRGTLVRIDEAELSEPLEQGARRLESYEEELAAMGTGTEGRVVWYDVAAKALVSTPVDLSYILRDRLFDQIPAVGLLSATLATGGRDKSSGFDFVKRRLGVPKAAFVRELRVESPFDYEKNCLLYLPTDLPAVNEPEFPRAAAARAVELIDASEGGAFFLTTSIQAAQTFARALRQSGVKYPIYAQGERPKDALIAAFRAAENAVLVATMSFWEGVDVPGRALRLVILDKLPFSVPTDPVIQARSRAIEARGGSPFVELSLPEAAITLKQGFGRLIRTETDRGVVAIFDSRIVTRSYGKQLLRALPSAPRTSSLEEARARARALSLIDVSRPDARGRASE